MPPAVTTKPFDDFLVVYNLHFFLLETIILGFTFKLSFIWNHLKMDHLINKFPCIRKNGSDLHYAYLFTGPGSSQTNYCL